LVTGVLAAKSSTGVLEVVLQKARRMGVFWRGADKGEEVVG